MTTVDLRRIQAQARASAVLSLQHDDCLAYWRLDYREMSLAGEELGLAMVRHPIRDFDIGDMRRQMRGAVLAMARLRSLQHRIYVHCTAGLGRAPLVVLGYLVLVENFSPEEAIQKILIGRPGAVPAWEAFHGACDDLETCYRKQIEQRAYDIYMSDRHHDPLADWTQAKSEILRSVLM